MLQPYALDSANIADEARMIVTRNFPVVVIEEGRLDVFDRRQDLTPRASVTANGQGAEVAVNLPGTLTTRQLEGLLLYAYGLELGVIR